MRDSKDVLTDLVALLQPHTSYPVGTDNVLSTVQALLEQNTLLRNTSGGVQSGKPESAEAKPDKEDVLRPSYMVNDRVEVWRKNIQQWWSGHISHAHSNGTYDLTYTNGVIETQIKEDQIRRKVDVATAVRSMDLFEGGVKLADGKVEKDSSQNIFTTKPTTEDVEKNEENKEGKFHVGDAVEVNLRCEGVWHAGQIDHVNKEGFYTVHFGQGDFVCNIVPERVRKATTEPPKKKKEEDSKSRTVNPSATANTQPAGHSTNTANTAKTAKTASNNTEPSILKVGDRIEVNCRNKGVWYPGVVKSVSYFIGTCDISFDHGEREYYVPLEIVRRPTTLDKEGSNASTDPPQTTPTASATTSTTTTASAINSTPDKSNLADACTMFVLKLAGLLFVLLIVFLAPFFLFLVLSAKLGLKL